MCERAYRRASLARIHQAVSAIAKTGNPTDSLEKFQISLVEIHKATKNFSEETHIKRRDDNVGIYKGPIYDHLKKHAAAIKVYHPNYRFHLHGVKFRSELETVSILHHENFAPFIGSFGHGGCDFLEEGATGNTNIKQCFCKVANGRFMKAVKVLSSFGVATFCNDTINALKAKHPYMSPSCMHSITFFKHPLIAEIDSVFGCIKSFLEDSESVAKVLNTIKVSGPDLGLELNIKKTKMFWPSCNGMKLREGLFPVNIRRPSSGVKLLGGAVSRDAYFISGLAMRRLENAIDLMSLLSQLHDPQSLRGSIENIVVCDGPFFGDLQWRRASLPIRFGGLGFYSAKVVSRYAFDDDYFSALACLRDTIPSLDFSGFINKDTAPSKAQQTLNVLFNEMIKDMEVYFDMTMRQEVVFEYLYALRAQDSLLVSSIDGIGQNMSPVEYCTIHNSLKSSRDSSTDTIWLGTSFLTYVGMPKAPLKEKHLRTL
nr:hypothetical protein [Tanacetum cinerariifolium]